MTDLPPDVVHVGSACRDLVDDDPRGWRLGGGVSYASLTTARLGLRTAAVVGVDGLAAAASELELLRDAGVQILPVPLAEGPVFRNEETPGGRVQHWPVRGHRLPVPALPGSWAQAPAWSLVPVASELGEGWADTVPASVFVSLAWQGLLREQGPDQLTARRAPASSPLLAVARLVGVSREDLPAGTGPAELTGFVRPGAQVALTDGFHGGELISVQPRRAPDVVRWAAVPPVRVVDPTGAGDVFLAALLAATVRPDLTIELVPRSATPLEFAAAAASLVVEAPGLLGVPDRSAVLDRLRAARPSRDRPPGDR